MLELVVVVAILAIIASAAIMSFGNTASDAQEQTARFSMKQIAGAIEAYYEDNKNTFPPPGRESPADLGFLFDASMAGASTWNPDYRQGWRGPYLKQVQYMYVDIGDDLASGGHSTANTSVAGEPNVIDNTELSNILAVSDPYEHYPVDDGVTRSFEPCATNNCMFEWQKTLDPFDDTIDSDDVLEKFGRPYLVVDLTHMSSTATGAGVPRVVSLGPNGIYEPYGTYSPSLMCDYAETDSTQPDFCTHDDLCQPDPKGDDLILCLR